MGKTNGFPWRAGAFYHGDDQQFWCGINVIFRCGNFRNLQCTICIFRGGTGHFTWHLDLYFQAALILSLMIMRKNLFRHICSALWSDLHSASFWMCMKRGLIFCQNLLDFAYCILSSVICCCALALRFLTAVDCQSFRRTCFRGNYHRSRACVIPESKSVMM